MNESNFTTIRNTPEYSLTESERNAIRTHLVGRMHLRPSIERTSFATPSPWFTYLMRPMPVMAFALILLVGTSSVSFAAGGALPGDILYPVKVSIKEPLETYLAPGVAARAKVQVRQAEERLKESEILAVRGELDEATAATAAASVSEDIQKAVDSARTLASAGNSTAADDIHARISAVLDAHSELLDAQSENMSDEPRRILRALSVATSITAYDAREEESEDIETDDRTLRDLALSAQVRAKERLEEINERLRENGIPDETETEFSLELARLSATYAASGEFVLTDDYPNAARAYEDIDKRAYRVLALLVAAQRIAESTDQEVVIVLDQTQNVAPARAKGAAPESDTMTMRLMFSSSTPEEVAHEAMEAPQPERKLQFRVRREE